MIAAADTADAAMTDLARPVPSSSRRAVALVGPGAVPRRRPSSAEGEEQLRATADGWPHHGFRLAAPAALDDGWGDPVRWLLETWAASQDRGVTRGADAVRVLLRDAGIP